LHIYFQRACYLSLNPLKEESMEGEKSQYTLPDGSSIEVIILKIPIHITRWKFYRGNSYLKSQYTLPDGSSIEVIHI
jgi:hypothetical protein